MPIDPAIAIGADLGETPFSWESSDVLLYHLGIGAGADPLSPRELRYAYEKNLRVLPTFAIVAPTLRVTERPRVSFPGIEIDLAKVVHGSQAVTVHQPIPVAGKAIAGSRIAGDGIGDQEGPGARKRAGPRFIFQALNRGESFQLHSL